MLYDPKWEVKVKPDVYSLEGLIAWLEKQPADKKYNWASTNSCLCSQYFVGGGYGWADMHEEFKEKTGIRLDKIAHQTPWTFGAALQRVRELV